MGDDITILKIGRRMMECVCLHHTKLESYLNMGPQLLGRIAQTHTFRPYLLAGGKSTSGKRPDGILCQPDEVRSPLLDSLLLLFDD